MLGSSVILLLGLVIGASADISGTDPPDGACLCMTHDAVNIRDAACGNVIGMENAGACFTYTGNKEGCTMDATYYEYFEFDYDGQNGWAAGDFMDQISDTPCEPGGSGDTYSCPLDNEGMRVHETTAPTPYDCVDGGCQNTCMGGQCVALVTCSCQRNGNWPPGTNCWSPGEAVSSGGVCNRNIPSGTAIATFSGGVYYAGHAAIFVSCLDDYTIQVWDQWCCDSIGYSTFTSSHEYFTTFAVLENNSCADRTSWECRWEPGGPTCCNVVEPGCEVRRYWWEPFTPK